MTTLRDFFTRQFFLAAFLPTLIFVSTNAAIAFVWSWPIHDWIREQLFEATATHQAVTVAIIFFVLWIWSYLTAALTPHWTRTLEGKTWSNPESVQAMREATTEVTLKGLWRLKTEKKWDELWPRTKTLVCQELWRLRHLQAWLVIDGIKSHMKRFDLLNNQLEAQVRTYAEIESCRPAWESALADAANDATAGERTATATKDSLEITNQKIKTLQKARSEGRPISSDAIRELFKSLQAEIPQLRNFGVIHGATGDIALLTRYAFESARREHSRLFNERNVEFGERPEILPTRFGNVGLSAQAYAMRAYNCNLTLIWSALKRVAAKDDNSGGESSPQSQQVGAAKTIADAKAQLDFFVACFWFSLALAVGWAVIFAWYGEWRGAIGAAIAGPFICWSFWYGAAVEQYRVLQTHIISSLNGPLRFNVLEELRLGLPADITEERKLWNDFDLVVGHGQAGELKYHHPKNA